MFNLNYHHYMLEGVLFIGIIILLFYIKDLKNKEASEVRKLKEKTWRLELAVEEERTNKADSENHAKISREFLEDERLHSKQLEQQLSDTEEKLKQETEQRKKVLSQKKAVKLD